MYVKVDYHQCIGCKRCYQICPMDVFVIDEEIKMPRVEYEEDCWFCGICFIECPQRAIDITYPVTFW